MNITNLYKAVEAITKDAINTVAKRRGAGMRFKVGVAFSDTTEYRVPVYPVRPVARLAAFYDLFAEAEEEIQLRHAGLRVGLVPEKLPRRQIDKHAGVRKPVKGRGRVSGKGKALRIHEVGGLTMATWSELAQDNLNAAKALHKDGFVRSCMNRAFYSAYAGITGALHSSGFTVSSDERPNPSHHQLQVMARNNLDEKIRKTVSRDLNRLLAFRVVADYDPMSSLEAQDSLMAVQCASRVIAAIGGFNS